MGVSPPGGAPTSGRERRRVSVVGVAGELLLTAGVIVLLFVAWQLWISDIISGAQNNARAHELAQQWSAEATTDPTPDASEEPTEPTEPPVPTEPAEIVPPVAPEPGDGEVFGIMYIPSFGPDYAVQMAGGVSRSRTLDTIGIGHYPGTQMPGEVGNSAYAAHRTGYGGSPFYRIAELRVGDPIVIETPDGWYTYRFRNLEYVKPWAVNVLHPVPQDISTPAGERYLTLTSCSPKHTAIERIVAYSSFDSFQPRADGPPAVLLPEPPAPTETPTPVKEAA